MLRIRKFGENQSGYNAALWGLLFLFCVASPESVFAKVMPRLERVAAVSTLDDHASDTALAKPIVADPGRVLACRCFREARCRSAFELR